MISGQMLVTNTPSVAAVGGGGGGEDEETLAMKKSTVQPCAACRLLRRRCAPDCPFSPYFSPNEPHKFASVHKVFGASNVSKMLMEVPEDQRADTANSLVYEATVRLREPVYGCVGAISILQQQVQSLEAELNAVRAEMLRYKLRKASIMAAPPCPYPHESNLPISRRFSTTTPPPASAVLSSQMPTPLAAPSGSSILMQANMSASPYNIISGGSVAYFN